MSTAREASATFRCFGSSCSVHVTGPGRDVDQAEAVRRVERQLLAWHDRFTRFEPDSELSRLNADPRTEVPVSDVMARFVRAAIEAAEKTAGLVDATQLDQLEAAGYKRDLRPALPLALALASAPARRPARPSADSRWHEVAVDPEAGVVCRPRGLRLDSGGIAKGLFADLVARRLSGHQAFAVDCAGDLRIGGSGGVPRVVHVASPFDQRVLHSFELVDRGIATSGIGKRSWLDRDGRPAHHLLDPGTGRPAFTGIVQATALAPSAYEAELRAKAAVLAGPGATGRWLPHGGLVVFDDGGHHVLPPRQGTLRSMEPTSAGELVKVAGGGPELDGLVFDTPSRSKVVVAVVDPGRGPVFRTVHPRTLIERTEEGPDDRALRLLVRRTPPPVRGAARGGTASGRGRAGHARGATHRSTGK